MEPKFDKPELKCRGGCGYYGNPNWEGYCSLCRKKYFTTAPSPVADDPNLADRFRTPSFSIKASATPPVSPSLSRADSSRHSKESPSHVNTLKKTASHSGESHHKNVASDQHFSSPTRSKPIDKFGVMLRALPRSVSSELENTLKHFLQKLHSRTFASIDELSDFVQKFYVRLEEKLGKNNVYVALPSQVRDELWDEVESHVCVRLYKTVFAHLQDEEADLALHNKLRSLLKELNPVDLELPPAFADSKDTDEENDDNMKHLLDDAFFAIVDMTTKATPQEILGCLSACCSALFNALRAALPGPPSADDFLPALIYCVIRTNPPQIHATIAYVERFALPRRILDGEVAYYFTNLCCAVRYLDSTDAATIKAKSKRAAAHEADVKEAAERGCSVAAVKLDHRLNDLATKTEGELAKRVNDLGANVAQAAEKFASDAKELSEQIQTDCKEADKDIESQLLIDFSSPDSSPGSGLSKNAEVLKLYALGTMDSEGVERLKSSLAPAKESVVASENQNSDHPSQPLLIDFDSEVPSASPTPATTTST